MKKRLSRCFVLLMLAAAVFALGWYAAQATRSYLAANIRSLAVHAADAAAHQAADVTVDVMREFSSDGADWIMHWVMPPSPDLTFERHEGAFRAFISALDADDSTLQRAAAALGRYGVTHIRREGNCIRFTFFALMASVDPVSELWYCRQGFKPLPPRLAELEARHSLTFWKPLAPDWGYRQWD